MAPWRKSYTFVIWDPRSQTLEVFSGWDGELREEGEELPCSVSRL